MENLDVIRITPESRHKMGDQVVDERPLTVYLNDKEIVTLLCSPMDERQLAVGFLVSEGFLGDKGELKDIILDRDKGLVWVQTKGRKTPRKESVFNRRPPNKELSFKRLIGSGCGKAAMFYNAIDKLKRKTIVSKKRFLREDLFSAMDKFQRSSELFKSTGGVHSAALSDGKDLLVIKEDIGRHNAVDKVFGQCLLDDVSTKDKILLSSGRLSSEIVLKVQKREVPIAVSRSAPTDQAVKLARDLNMTLVGFARGKRMNVYSNDWRIV